MLVFHLCICVMYVKQRQKCLHHATLINYMLAQGLSHQLRSLLYINTMSRYVSLCLARKCMKEHPKRHVDIRMLCRLLQSIGVGHCTYSHVLRTGRWKSCPSHDCICTYAMTARVLHTGMTHRSEPLSLNIISYNIISYNII